MSNAEVIGLDLSLTSTGVAVGSRTLVIASKFKGVQRLDDVENQILKIFQAVWPPIVVLEGYSFASRNSQAHSIGELGGVIKMMCHDHGIPVAISPPTCRAKFATGRGNASKAEVMSAVSARTGIVWSGKGAEDQCDAWILQEMGLARLGEARHDWPKTHLEGLVNTDWTQWIEMEYLSE